MAVESARPASSWSDRIASESSISASLESLQHESDLFAEGGRAASGCPLAQAKKALKQFPAIGDPGAEKILLFCRAFPILALESNGLRVLMRLGYGEEKPNYATTYRLVQEATEGELVVEYSWLITTHQLLRRHGQELCRRSRPLCEKCPLLREYPWVVGNRDM